MILTRFLILLVGTENTNDRVRRSSTVCNFVLNLLPGNNITMSGFTQEQRRFISGEITTQLRELKKQIDKELQEDIETLRGTIEQLVDSRVAELTRGLESVDKRVKTVSKNITDVKDAIADVKTEVQGVAAGIDGKITAMNGQLVTTGERQLALSKAATKEIIQVVGQKIANDVYDNVLGEINKTIVPKVNDKVNWVNYQTQDTGELITDYRRAVDRVSNSGQKFITDGNDKHVITPHVRLFFDDNHSDA